MYNNQNNELPQYLADMIQQSANAGVVQQHVWHLASQNNWQNDFFNNMVNTLNETCMYWSGNGTQAYDVNQAISTVYHCSCGMQVARYPQMAQQMSQADYNNWMQWANQAQQLSGELSQFMAQFRQPQYAQQYNQPYARAAAPRPGMNPSANSWDQAQAQQQGGWGQPAAPVGNHNRNSNFAVPGNTAPVSRPVQPQPQTNTMGPRQGSSRYGNRQQNQPQGRPTTVLKQAESQSPQFITPRQGTWRSRNNTSDQQPFNPHNPQHAPVGREVAEQHEAAARASGSWDSSNFDWDDTTISFEDEVDNQTSHVQSNHSKQPQFMERISSNPDVPHLIFGKDTPDGYFEFDISDWKTKPDPDFPWEIGYTPATRTRRIAFDVKRQCYVQIIEENDVKYDDHKILDKSAAVSQTLASRARPERSMAEIDNAKVVTLGELATKRQSIIDNRLESAKEQWKHQEEKARSETKEGEEFVPPVVVPSREEALATPTDKESDEDVLLAAGQLTEDQIVNIDMGNHAFMNEAEALYEAQSRLVGEKFDITDSPLLVTRYNESTPFLLNAEEAEHAIEKLKPLAPGSQIKTLVDVAKYLKSIVDDIPLYLWNAIDAQLTEHMNSILSTELGLDGVSIDSFADDAPDLPKYLKENKGIKFVEALGRHISELMTPMRCIATVNNSDDKENPAAALTVMLRRETTLAKLAYTSKELGLYADQSEFGITASSAPNMHKLLSTILKETAREDGKAGYFKRVLLLEDGVRFTIHEGWMGDGSVLILKR